MLRSKTEAMLIFKEMTIVQTVNTLTIFLRSFKSSKNGRYVLNLTFKMVLSSTNQTTLNHEGCPFVFHTLKFNLELHFWGPVLCIQTPKSGADLVCHFEDEKTRDMSGR